MSNISTIKINNTHLKLLSKNLRILLDKRGLSESEIAQAINIPVMTVRRIVSGETTDPRISTLTLLADFFNVSIDSLIEDNEYQYISSMSKNKPQFIPLLDWITAATMQSLNDIDLKSWKNWHPVTSGDNYTLSDQTFALESRPSMQPRFPIGTIFIIDPNETPTDMDIILIKIKNDNTLSLRELIIDSPKWQLQPVVHGSEGIFYDEKEHQIIGVTVLTMLFTRR
ncbi:MAG: helix-turn-helix domain-containing protein [Gammaproteobacteria bacterium]